MIFIDLSCRPTVIWSPALVAMLLVSYLVVQLFMSLGCTVLSLYVKCEFIDCYKYAHRCTVIFVCIPLLYCYMAACM